MPWEVKQGVGDCSGFAVVKKGTEKVLGCHSSRGKALRQVRALYANEAQTAAAVDALTDEILAAGTYVEAKHPRHPAGSEEGGRWRDLTDAELSAAIAELDATANANLHAERSPETTKAWLDAIGDKHEAEREATRRSVEEIAVSPEIQEQIDKISQYQKHGYVGITPVDLEDGQYVIYRRDDHGGSQKYEVFRGTKEDVARYAQRDYDGYRSQAIRSARSQADVELQNKFERKVPLTVRQAVSDVPNEWAVEHGYADWVDLPAPKSYGYGGYGGHSVGGTVRSINWKNDADPERVLFHFLGGKRAPANLKPGDPGYEQWAYMTKAGERPKNKAQREEAVRRLTAALLASAGFVVAGQMEFRDGNGVTAAIAVMEAPPIEPPADWFDDPQLEGPTPLTVTPEGRVFGHLAEWGKCHMGIQGACILAPRSQTEYRHFYAGGKILLDNGEMLPVGRLTVGTGHAPLSVGRTAAAAHYDNTGAVVAFVRAGEDEFGPWLAGAVKSDATPEQIRDLRGNPPSGDWRKVQGVGLELVAALAVPVPGYPVASVTASGDVEALIMAYDDGPGLALVAALEVDDTWHRRIDALAALALPDTVIAGMEYLHEKKRRWRLR